MNKEERKVYHQKRYNTVSGRLYQVYRDIVIRCSNPSCKDYKYYGGRGILNCFTSFEDFFRYVTEDMGITEFAQINGLQIDRINNNSHYQPGNIRFVTRKINMRNRRNSKCKV